MAEWIGKLILYTTAKPDGKRCPCLTEDDCNFLELHGKTDTWNLLNLAETKVHAVKFLASGAFVDSERVFPAIFASADSNSRIYEIGNDILKRAAAAISLEDTEVIGKIFKLYLGSKSSNGPLPARIPLRIKLLAYLSRSRISATFTEECLEIVQLGLTSEQQLNLVGDTSKKQKGLENSKLRRQIFAFTNWLSRISPLSVISKFAPAMIGHLRSYIDEQGWPRPRSEDTLDAAELASRSYGYESIGLLAAACPEQLLLEPNIELLRWLMTSLSEDPSSAEVSLSIEHAISSTMRVFGSGNESNLEQSLASLFLHHMALHPDSQNEERYVYTSNQSSLSVAYMSSIFPIFPCQIPHLSTVADGYCLNSPVVRSTQFVAVRFANRCLPYQSIDGRYIDVLALCTGNDSHSNVYEEGRKGLHPYWHTLLNPKSDQSMSSVNAVELSSAEFPSFPELAQRLFGSESDWNLSKPRLAKAFVTALDFGRCILLHQALDQADMAPKIEESWEQNIDAILHNDGEARDKLILYLSDRISTDKKFRLALSRFLFGCFEALVGPVSSESGPAGKLLIEQSTLLPSTAFEGLWRDTNKLKGPIFSHHEELRTLASHFFGLLGSLGEDSDPPIRTMVTNFFDCLETWKEAIGSDSYKVHGSILALGFYLSRSTRRGRCSLIIQEHTAAFIDRCHSIVTHGRDKLLVDAVLAAISELSLFYTNKMGLNLLRLTAFKDMLFTKSKDGNEKAIAALGHLAMQCPEEESGGSDLWGILDHLHELHSVRRAEVQFAVGEALSCSAVGWRSKALTRYNDVQEPLPISAARTDTLSKLLDRTLQDCKSTKPALRQATVIWLLSLVQFCGQEKAVQTRLKDCQVAFKGFLIDRESLNQESASRGLSVIYEQGDKSLKEDLIKDLVGSFTGTGSTLAGTVSEDTELFDAGALPTGDGSIRTYKDIMSLASEIGDSSMVYKFMSLASHDAIWASRTAFGRFGLSNILNDADADGFVTYNPKLYPALFRYRFDPNTNVRRAMNDIWISLVKDPSATIRSHFKEILDDLLKNIFHKEWRTREACCAAIADLLQAQPLELYEQQLNEIWSAAFKVCDDIKESVRRAAMSLARTLTGILIRSLEAGESSTRTANAMLKEILPFLMSTRGLEAGAAEVQQFSRKTILDIIKKAHAKTIRPFVPELVGRLLALLSSIEPEMVNYLHMNAETFGYTKTEIDDARLKHLRGSSMLEGIERCLEFLDEDSMSDLQKQLENAIKSVIGLPSKIGCSRVLVSLSTRQNFIFRPYAAQFLPLAYKQALDRNDTVSSAYATACGYIARLASDTALTKMIEECRKLYFDSDDERHRATAGDMLYAFSKHATDRFNSFAAELLPLVFVAKHDLAERTRSSFEDTWNENVGGQRAVLLHLSEITDLIGKHMESNRWTVKHTCCYAAADVVESAGSTISSADAQLMWPVLEKALGGKTWDGKEKVLKAFVKFVERSDLAKVNEATRKQMRTIMVRESKRNNAVYREHAFACLADFVNIPHVGDMFDATFDLVAPVVEELLGGDPDDMDVDSKSGGHSSKARNEMTIAHGLSAILHAIPTNAATEEAWKDRLARALPLLNKIPDSESKGAQKVLVAIFDALRLLFQKLATVDALSVVWKDPLPGYADFMFRVAEGQVEHVRLKAAEAAHELAITIKASSTGNGEAVRSNLVGRIRGSKEKERSAGVRQVLERALKALGE